MKEHRVYLYEFHIDSDSDDDFFNAESVENFYLYEGYHNKLNPQAERFIELCEQEGTVYSLSQFCEELNNDRLNTDNFVFYITDKY